MSYKLMKEFLDHKGEQQDPEKVIREYEEIQELEKGLSAESDGDEGGEEEKGGGEDEEMETADVAE